MIVHGGGALESSDLLLHPISDARRSFQASRTVARALETPCNKPLPCLCRLQLSVKGYNDKQHIILKKIVEKMATFEIDEKRFDIIKEAVSGPTREGQKC